MSSVTGFGHGLLQCISVGKPNLKFRICSAGPEARPCSTLRSSKRQSIVCQAGFGKKIKSPEEALKNTVELDKFIDKLISADTSELPKKVAENVFAFDQSFWLRLATRAETGSKDEQKDMEELASQIMLIVEAIVKKTQEKIEVSTMDLSSLLQNLADSENGEIVWPPKDPQQLLKLKQAIYEKEQSGNLDETFLSEVSAQLRQAIETNDRPGLIALLRKVLQLYAASWLSRRPFSVKTDGSVDACEKLLEEIMEAEEESWQSLILSSITLGGGSILGEALLVAVTKRMERVLMRTEGGSYQQRVIGEYLVEIEGRVKAVIGAYNLEANEDKSV